jgi:sugar-specific transcriptional regulator TrmB
LTAEPIESAIQLLCAFGLTVNQAKIYLAIAFSKADTVKVISKISHIPSESIYRTMPTLEIMGLVYRVLSTPAKYRAIPIQETIELLKARDEKEREDLYNKANHLTKNLLVNLPANLSEESEEDTILVIGYDAWVRKLGCGVNNASKSFQGITYAESFRQGMFNNGKSYEKCLQRGVECRHIVHQIGKKELYLLGDSHLLKNPLWKRKYTLPSALSFAIIDKKELLISLTPSELGKKHRAMCTTNPGLVALALNYFESLWNMAST